MLSNSDCCCWQTFTQQEQNLIVINSTAQYLKEELLGSYNYYPKPLWSNVVFGISELWYRIVGFFHSLLKIPYKRETFEGENYCKLVKNTTFVERTFVDCLFLLPLRKSYLQILRRKLLRIATKPWNLWTFAPSKVSRYTVVNICWKPFRWIVWTQFTIPLLAVNMT